MNLYQKLFGFKLMKPAGEDEGGGGGSADRGDNYVTATGTEGGAEGAGEGEGEGEGEGQLESDLKLATGEGEEQPRDKDGKFAKKDKTDPVIPKSRFDEAVRKERERAEAAERELAEIRRAQQQITRGADIGKLEKQVRDLRGDAAEALFVGDREKAAELNEQADRLNRQIAIEQARDMSAQAKESAREEIRWDMTLDSIEAKYPELDPNAEEFDQDLTDDVVDAMNGVMQRERLPRSQALLKAVERVMARRAPPAKTGDADDTPKGLDRGPEKDRKEAAVQKNLDAAKRQPASTKKVGADSDKHGQTKDIPDASEMTFEEFNALPESTRAKMRGDFVN